MSFRWLAVAWATMAFPAYPQAGNSTRVQPDPVSLSPTLRVVFEPSSPIKDASVSPVIALPIECSNDGTALLNMLQPPDFKTQTLLSVSPTREIHAFRIEQAPDLYDVRMIDHYVSDSGLVFLVEASRDSRQVKQTVVASDGRTWEQTRSAGERHYYAVTFDRDGRYSRIQELDNSIHPHRIGVFPSGILLVSVLDATGSARLSLLQSDGILISRAPNSKIIGNKLNKPPSHSLPEENG